FAVTNVNSGTPIATISAGVAGATYLTADGTLATTAQQTLTLGNGTTGNIVLSPLSTATVNGGLTVTGTTKLTSLSTGVVHISSNGTLTSSAVNLANSDVTGILPLANGGTNANLTAVSGGVVYSNGSALAISTAGSNGYCLVSTSTSAPVWQQCATGPTAGINYWTLQNGALNTINNTADLLVGGVSTNSAKFAVLGVNTTTTTASVSGQTGSLVLDNTGSIQTTADQNLTIGGGATGNITLNPLNTVTVNGAQTINGTQTVNGNLTATGTIDFSNLGIGVVHAGSGGVLSSSAVNLANSDVTGVLPVTHGGTGLSTITSGALLYGNATGNVSLLNPAAPGNVLVSNGTAPTYTTALTGLTQLTSSGTIDFTGLGIGVVHSSSNGTLSSSAVNLANTDVTGILPLANGGTNGNLTAIQGGVVYSNATGLAISTAGITNECLVSNGTSAPSWATCAIGAASVNYWGITGNGAIAPINDTLDVLIGGQSTSSAKFGFINVAGGNPTATISATTGSTYLTAAGTLATTNNQTLNIGNGTTGNIVLNPLSSVTVNGAQTVNGNLTATGTIDFSNLGIGVVHAGSGGVLSSSAVNLANSDVTGVL
ncbi:MAG: hypothetical protein KGJ07_08940, partial [Patescibacteria group bacterium]|nr:hypothetical protein [Patescibacteria group bacterium]